MIAKSKGKSNILAQFDKSNHDVAHSRIWLTDTTKKNKIDTWASAKDMP
jgi:hypothetical protein